MKKFLLLLMVVLLGLISACTTDTDTPEEIVYELNTNLTDATDLQKVEYEGREFIADGIGVVELDQCIDGDTTRFRSQGGSSFSVRYIGIDTPESTGNVEPWGFPASDYVCDVLTNANEIVLESDPNVGRIDNFGRQLAYVWYDGRLLNLELVELAYTAASGTGLLKYGDEMFEAQSHARMTNRRIWGEDDPIFTADPHEVTITDLTNNPEQYYRSFVNLEAVIVERSGTDRILSDGDNTIFLYTHGSVASILGIGHRVRFENLFFTSHRNQYQVTNFNARNTEYLGNEE